MVCFLASIMDGNKVEKDVQSATQYCLPQPQGTVGNLPTVIKARKRKAWGRGHVLCKDTEAKDTMAYLSSTSSLL